MKIIRWPAVAVLALALLVGFFWMGHAGDEVVRRNLETLGAYELKTLFRVGAVDLSVYESYLRIGRITVMDPGQRGAVLFAAEEVDLRADPTSFFARRVRLHEAHVASATARVLQTRDGRFVFLSDAARAMLGHEPLHVRARRIVSRAAQHINPLAVAGMIAPRIAPIDRTPRTNHVGHAREFRLPLPRRPEFALDLLTVSNGVLNVFPAFHGTPLILHGIFGYCSGISSLPRGHAMPISFAAFGYVGHGTDAWVAAMGEVDFRGTSTNIMVDFAFSNIALRSILPFARVYTRFLDNLRVETGTLSAHGRVKIEGRVVQPSTVQLQVADLTARADGFSGELAWLNALAISNTTLAIAVPIDNTPPYVHIDQALKEQRVRTQIERFELRINVRDLQHDFLKGLQIPRVQ